MELDPKPEVEFDRYNRTVERRGIMERSLGDARRMPTPRDPQEAELHLLGIKQRKRAIEITDIQIEELIHEGQQYAADNLPLLREEARTEMEKDFYYRGELQDQSKL